MMKSMVFLGFCCILLSVITTINGQPPPFRSFPRFAPPRILRGPPGFGRFGLRPPIGRPAFFGEGLFAPPRIQGRPIFAPQPNNAIFNTNPFGPPLAPVNVLNNGLQGFPPNTIIQGNPIGNPGVPTTFGTNTQNTGNVGTTTNTIGNLPFGTTNTGAPAAGITGTGLPLNVNSGFPATVNTGFSGPVNTGAGFPTTLNTNAAFPGTLNSVFPGTINTGFPATLNSAFPAPLPNTAFPGTGPGFFGTINTGLPPNTGAVVPGTTNVAGTNTLAGSGFTTGTGTLSNQFLLNNGVPALSQVNSLGTQVTSNAQTNGNQDSMVLAAGNTFANRFTVTGDGASQTGTFGGDTGGATFQDPTSGQTISGNTLVNTGTGTDSTAVDTSGVIDTQGGTGLTPDVAVIGNIGTDTANMDPNTQTNAPATEVGSKCQATGCSADQQCVFAGEYPCAMYLESLECRCQAGCRVMNFFIPEGQSRQVDSCGNVCTCDQTGENKGTARCTTINCPQQ
ncbi:uncharacterized protein [Argopecten irradians]|uniref:uncharacterized protein n=1 Tax=Argopecten irradians TaxID=31199 RepID=UPI00370F7930